MVTFVSDSVKDDVEKRSDWPEIEAKMKKIYGTEWKLVTYERKFRDMAQPLQEG